MFCPWSGKLLENWQSLDHKKFITASVGLCCLSSNDQQSIDLSNPCKVTMLNITTPHWQCANVLQIEFIFNRDRKKSFIASIKELINPMCFLFDCWCFIRRVSVVSKLICWVVINLIGIIRKLLINCNAKLKCSIPQPCQRRLGPQKLYFLCL